MFQDDLTKLKVGDEVALVNYGGWEPTYSLVRITRITKTQIIVGDSRFKSSNGYPIGSSTWSCTVLRILTPELQQEMAEAKVRQQKKLLCRQLSEFDWKTLSLQDLLDIHRIAVKKKQEENAHAGNQTSDS